MQQPLNEVTFDFHVRSVRFQFHPVPNLGLVRVKFGKEAGFFIIINRRSANSASTIKLVKLMQAKRDKLNNQSLQKDSSSLFISPRNEIETLCAFDPDTKYQMQRRETKYYFYPSR